MVATPRTNFFFKREWGDSAGGILGSRWAVVRVPVPCHPCEGSPVPVGAVQGDQRHGPVGVARGCRWWWFVVVVVVRVKVVKVVKVVRVAAVGGGCRCW